MLILKLMFVSISLFKVVPVTCEKTCEIKKSVLPVILVDMNQQ